MKRLIVLAALTALAAASISNAATRDPRKCGGVTTWSLTTPRPPANYTCTQQAVEKALARHGIVNKANLLCQTGKPWRLLVWRCSWGSPTTGTATVRFAATSAGWRTYVTVKP